LSKTILLSELNRTVRACVLCPLSKNRKNAVPGQGSPQADILLLGEAPGESEDRVGRPFVGRAGTVLDRAIRLAGLRRSDLYITNVVKCRPPGNRVPKEEEMKSCSRYLKEELGIIQPKVIVTLGRVPLSRFKKLQKIQPEPFHYKNFIVVPSYHPAASLHGNRQSFEAIVLSLRLAKKLAHPK
jgi:uracil-DNA glycosylase family 4